MMLTVTSVCPEAPQDLSLLPPQLLLHLSPLPVTALSRASPITCLGFISLPTGLPVFPPLPCHPTSHGSGSNL